MARINTYSTDTSIQKDDRLLGSNNNGATRNFTIEDLGTFQANTNSGAVIGQLPYVYHNNSFGGNAYRQSGSITINTSDATTAFSSVTTIKVSKTPNGYENDVIAVLNSFLNKDIIISSNDNPNNFATYTCTAVTQDSSETDFYDLSLTYIDGNGNLEVNKFYSASRDISTSENTTYDISVPTGTTSIRLEGNDASTDDIAITGLGSTTVARVSDSEISISSSDQYTGTVTSVGGTGTVSGLTLSGTVTSSGNLTLSGSLVLTSGQITTGLGYTPYNATNPDGFTSFAEPGIFSGGGTPTLATGVTAEEIRTLIGAGTSSSSGTVTSVSGTGTVSGLTLSGTVTSSGSLTLSGVLVLNSSQITTGLGYTPYDDANPDGFTSFAEPGIFSGGGTPTLASGVTASEIRTLIGAGTSSTTGTVTSVSGTGTVSGLSLSGTVTSSGNLTLSGTLSLTSSDITTGLGYTPYNSTNPDGYTTNTGTVTSVSGTGTVSGLTLSGTVTDSGSIALGGTLTLTSLDITTGLGYTPYNSTNPDGYTTNTGTVTSVTLAEGALIDLSGTNPITTSGTITIDVDLNELTTSTSDADGDFFAVVDTSGAQKKLTKANINLSGFNNDSGFVTSAGSIESADKALSVTLTVKNTEAIALTKGQVVCAAPSATPPSGNLIEVKLADNNGTDSMPAIGVLNEGLDAAGGANDEGEAIMFGKVSGIDTSAFDVGDEVFVSDTAGGLTKTKPTGVKYIQKIGVVIRDDASNGTIEVFGAGRTNDVPTPLYIDHANQRLGIGTTSPATPLDVTGAGRFSGFVRSNYLNTHDNSKSIIGAPSNYVSIYGGSGAEAIRIDSTGDVGIGTTSPSEKLTIEGRVHVSEGTTNRSIELRDDGLYISRTSDGGNVSQIRASSNGNNIDVRSQTGINLNISTNNALRIDQNRNVGIGTGTTPGARLNVKGVGTTSSTTALLIENSSGSDLFKIRDDGQIFQTGSTFTSYSAGEMRFRLHSSGATDSKSALTAYTNGGSLGSAYGELSLNNTYDSNAYVGGAILFDTRTSTSPIRFMVKDNSANPAEAMAITRTGNVGIGTTSPADKLDIVHTASNLLGLNYGANQLRFAVDNRSHIKWTGSSGTFYLSGRGNGLFIGSTSSDASARLHVKGVGATSSTTALLIEDSAGADLLTVRDDGNVYGTGAGAIDTNAAYGKDAFISNATGTFNAAFGSNSLQNNTASFNTAFGAYALNSNTSGTNNVAVGINSLRLNISGSTNTAVGREALYSNIAAGNTAVGYQAAFSSTSAVNLTAIGSNALKDNTTGNSNIAVGYFSLQKNTTGADNVSVGARALIQNTTGSKNAALGHEALRNNTASNNTAVGYQASFSNTTGSNNTAVGLEALKDNTSGLQAVAIGAYALGNNTTASFNVAVGVTSLAANTTGTGNVAVGYQSLYSNTIGTNNSAIGHNALRNTTGSDNVGLGYQAGYNNTTGGSNIAIGRRSFFTSTTGTGNIAIGREALYNATTASYNSALGYQALYQLTTGGENTAVGSQAGTSITTGSTNTALGYRAMTNVTTASGNTAIGRFSLYNMTASSNNVAVGLEAMYNATSGLGAVGVGKRALYNNTANYNVAVGEEALLNNTSGANNIAIGYRSLRANTTASNNTAIGFQALNNSTASGNTAVGASAMSTTTTGVNNSAFGHAALITNQTGTRNNAFGVGALRTMNGGIGNAGFGNETFRSTTTGSHNIGMGDYAGYYNTTGSNNIALGYRSNFTNTTGNRNVAIGYQALYDNTASDNTAIGHQALFDNTTGTKNTALSSEAGLNVTTGSNNVFLGNAAGRGRTTGSLNIALGPLSLYASSGTSSSNIAIGYYCQFRNTTGANNVAVGVQTLQDNTTGGYNVALGHNAGGSGVGDHGDSNVVIGGQARTGNFDASVILGRNATATASNQFVVGSSSYNAGTVTTETITPDKTWTVKINGTDYKIPIVAV